MLLVRLCGAACHQQTLHRTLMCRVLEQNLSRPLHNITRRSPSSLLKKSVTTPQLSVTRNLFKLQQRYHRFSMRGDKPDRNEVLVYTNGYYLYMISGYLLGGAVSTYFLARTVYHLKDRDVTHKSNFGLTWFDRMSDWWNELSPSSSLGWYLNGVIYALTISSICRMMLTRGFARIYMNPQTEEFRGISQNLLLRKRSTKFTCKNVKPKRPGQILNEMPGNFTVKGRPYLVHNRDFTSPKYYAIFRGAYDDSWR